MQTDFQKLKRRPFFVPLLMVLAWFALVAAAAVWLLDARVTTELVFVRHAEIEPGLQANPGLNEQGKARANGLLQLLANARPERGVDAVYAIEGSPSQQTAAPLAAKMGLAVNVVAIADWKTLLKKIRSDHVGEVVLVVADRQNLQTLLKDISDQDWPLDDTDYGSVFVVSESRLSKPAILRLRY